MRTSFALSLVLSLALTGAALAQVDASSPKAALKSLYLAIEQADGTGIQQLLFVENDPQQDVVKAYTKLILAGRRLNEVSKQKFPGAAEAKTPGIVSPEDVAKIDAAAVTVNGDKATVKVSAAADPVNLRQISGGWRLVIDQGDDATPAHRADRIALIQGMTDAINQSADEISADKYPTIQDAETVIKQRLGTVPAKVLQSNPPTSQPATKGAEG